MLDFDALCHGYCELAGLAAPQLVPDERGVRAFSIELRGVVITLLDQTSLRPGAAFMLAEFGDAQLCAQGWLDLLHANLILDGDAPRFSRDPHTGSALLQWACPLPGPAITDVYQRVESMAQTVLMWRRGTALPALTPTASVMPAGSPQDLLPPLHPQEPAAQAAHSFMALCRDISALLKQPVDGFDASHVPAGMPSTLLMQLDGVDMALVHQPRLRPDLAWMSVAFGNLPQDAPAVDITHWLDANFALLMHPQGAVFCRDPDSGTVLLRCAFPLLDMTAQRCLSQARNLAALARAEKAPTVDEVPDAPHVGARV